MSYLSILGVMVGLIVLIRGVFFLRSSKRTPEELVVWIAVGVALIFFSLFPRSIGTYANIFGVQESVSLFLVIGVLFLLLVSFWLYGMVIDLKRKVTLLHDMVSVNSFLIENQRTNTGSEKEVESKE